MTKQFTHHFITVICIAIGLFFNSCSLQKRHYRTGFYLENIVSKSKPSNFSKHSLQEKLYNHITENTVQVLLATREYSEKNHLTVTANPEKKELISSPKKKSFVSIRLKKEKNKTETEKHEVPDPSLNHVAKAGFRLAIYSLLFLLAAFYLFFELSALFYIVLGLLLITFILALVSFISSVAAGKDKISTDREGRRYSRFGVIVSLLIMAAIAVFLILTPITI